MGKMNLLKANYEGKVGQTVGAKWKNKSTIRTFSKPADPKTEAQMKVRGNFKILSTFIALFADAIKYLCALNTSGMSVKNAIMKINKEMISDTSIDLKNLVVSKGGLQPPATFSASYDTSTGKVTLTYPAPTATNLSENAQFVGIYVNSDNSIAMVGTGAVDAGSINLDVGTGITSSAVAYGYFLDKRGSSKIASISKGVDVTTA